MVQYLHFRILECPLKKGKDPVLGSIIILLSREMGMPLANTWTKHLAARNGPVVHAKHTSKVFKLIQMPNGYERQLYTTIGTITLSTDKATLTSPINSHPRAPSARYFWFILIPVSSSYLAVGSILIISSLSWKVQSFVDFAQVAQVLLMTFLEALRLEVNGRDTWGHFRSPWLGWQFFAIIIYTHTRIYIFIKTQ